jgi:hypothetical protein
VSRATPVALPSRCFGIQPEPRAFLDGPNQDPRILDLCKSIELRPNDGTIAVGPNSTCRLEVTLCDGCSAAIGKTDVDEDNTCENLQSI